MSDSMHSGSSLDPVYPPITSLSRGERRVLGVLIEKGITTPDQYPLTLKGATSGCNQKNNRDPITNYDEDQVTDILEKLRGRGLIAEVHTDTGRSARYRHYLRKRLTITEPQLAILAELLLRGRQQLGDLRTRASRMVEIATQELLRSELQGMQELGLIQTDGPLDRRGAEVDHRWYEPQEGRVMTARPVSAADDMTPASLGGAASFASAPVTRSPAAQASASLPPDTGRLHDLERQVSELTRARAAQDLELQQLRQDLERLQTAFEDFRRAVGG